MKPITSWHVWSLPTAKENIIDFNDSLSTFSKEHIFPVLYEFCGASIIADSEVSQFFENA